MKSATFRFYEELNDFLLKERRKVTFAYHFDNSPRIVDVIEQFGVPRSQVDLIIINGQSVGFEAYLRDNDRVAVYPIFESIDITPINKLRPKPLRIIKFIVDVHLGRLAKYLRMCGFDCYYESLDDDEIIDIALLQQRIILTKDRGLLKSKKVTHGYWIRSNEPKKQLIEVLNRFDLVGKIQFLERCLICNGMLRSITKEDLNINFPDNAKKFYDKFYYCDHCAKVYWEGSHYNNMVAMLKQIITSAQTKNSHERHGLK